ncbi:hypothetical protein [Leminorella grimontii]|uniref:phage tail fiber protein n=1 Tax=Leminorella grimontii TaxID=82981 RepID=UPI003220307E
MPPGSNATAEWDAEENKLKLGIPTGEEGPPAQLSALLESISALQTAANQIIYFTGRDSAATAALSEFGRSLIAAADKGAALEHLGLSEAAIKTDGAVPLDQGGTGATTSEVARVNLGLGSAAVLNAGTETGQVMKVGDTQYVYNAAYSGGSSAVIPQAGFLSSAAVGPNSVVKNLAIKASNASAGWVLYSSFGFYVDGTNSPNTSAIILTCTDGGAYTRNWFLFNNGDLLGPGGAMWGPTNTVVDANGFIKRASPVVKLFGDGGSEPNGEAVGVTSERISEGVYRLSGAIMGLCSDTAWHIEVPADENKQPLIWVDYEIEPTGDVIVKTYHRTHPTAPAFARNERDGYDDGEPIDIPAGRWVDLRVQVYSDEAQP